MVDTVRSVLMSRDGMSAQEAEDLIEEFEGELNLLMVTEAGLEAAEDLVQEYFGLEPDYLMEFLG